MVTFSTQINYLIYGTNPKYCNNYKEIYEISKEDPFLSSCILNCGMKYSCENINISLIKFKEEEMICYCTNILTIDYNDKQQNNFDYNYNLT